MDMIAVTGAAGKTGLAVVRALSEKGQSVRALVRREEQARAVRRVAPDATVLLGDLREPGSLASLLQESRAVYHICPNVHPDEVALGQGLLAAVQQTEIRHVVFHSVLHPQAEAMPHHWRKLRVEEMLLECGRPWTSLQPAPYMQNILVHRQRIVDQGNFTVPYALTARLSQVDLEDVAKVAARVLTEEGHVGAAYALCGPEILDANAMATELGRVLGRDVTAEAVSMETWRKTAQQAGLDEERCETLAAMFRYYDRFGLMGNPNVLGWLLGRPPTSFKEFVERDFCPQ